MYMQYIQIYICLESFEVYFVYYAGKTWEPTSLVSVGKKNKGPKVNCLMRVDCVVILQLLFSRESFVKTKAAKEHVIAGWEPKVNA